jgi:hypothetical protein
MVPTKMEPTACVREAMAVHRDVQIDGRYGPSGPISPKYSINEGIEILAPLMIMSKP